MQPGGRRYVSLWRALQNNSMWGGVQHLIRPSINYILMELRRGHSDKPRESPKVTRRTTEEGSQMLKELKDKFKGSWSETSDDHANTFYAQAMAATTRADFLKYSDAATRRAHAAYVKSQLTAPDDWSYSRIYGLLDANGHNLHLVIRACNNLRHSPLSEVNPLGYVLTDSEILKIISVDQESRTISHSKGWSRYGDRHHVNWFMPVAASEPIDAAQHTACVAEWLFGNEIDPRDHKLCCEEIHPIDLPYYVDYLYNAPGEIWRAVAELVEPEYRVQCLAMAMFSDVGTPNPFDYPTATSKGMFS